jgi:flagellar biosynthesis GTPase FlhF
LETKRFIGNDMPRIYMRIRNEFGPDAVIVRTRSLLREGAEPLIEVRAAPPEAEDALALELQQTLIQEALGRVERPQRPATIGDLEDMVSRQANRPARIEPPRPVFAEQPAPEHPWLQGYVADAPSAPLQSLARETPSFEREAPVAGELPAAATPDRFPSLTRLEPAAPPPNDWASRPRPKIITRTRREELLPDEPAALSSFARTTRRGSPIGLELLDAGFSEYAARLIEEACPAGGSASDALSTLLSAREVRYPQELRTALISIQGPPGAGRTMALMRMALDCVDAGRPAILLAADNSHVTGRLQVHSYAEALGLTAVDAFDTGEIVRATGGATKGACLFVDAPAGPWQAPVMPGVQHYQYVALPAHWQPAALARATANLSLAGFAGAVLTFTDLATTLSPVLSQVVEARLGIAFLSSGRDVGTGIEVADPRTLASGVLTTTTGESTDGRLVATA